MFAYRMLEDIRILLIRCRGANFFDSLSPFTSKGSKKCM